jgi:hypothetical protein
MKWRLQPNLIQTWRVIRRRWQSKCHTSFHWRIFPTSSYGCFWDICTVWKLNNWLCHRGGCWDFPQEVYHSCLKKSRNNLHISKCIDCTYSIWSLLTIVYTYGAVAVRNREAIEMQAGIKLLNLKHFRLDTLSHPVNLTFSCKSCAS